MATRDTRINIAAGVTGADSVKGLASEVRGVGTAAEGTAPGVAALTRQLDVLTQATADKRAAEAAARTEAAAQYRALSDLRDEYARTRAASDSATRGTVEFQEAMRAQRLAITEANIALRTRREAVALASQEAKTAAAAERALATEIERTRQVQVTGNTAVGASLDSLRGQLGTLRSVAAAALGGTLAGGIARDLAETADGYNNLRARIKLAAGEGQAFTDALRSVQDVAQRTGTSLQTTGDLFARVLQAGKEFNLTQRDALTLTEAIGQAVQLSGTAAQGAEAAITQLIQGLQAGVLRGDELNSVLEQSPRLAQALAAGLNVTLGDLRKLAEQGALTARVVTDALKGQAQTLQAEFDRMPPTVERAVARLGSAWQVYIGTADGATGATATAASAIEALARNLDGLGTLLYSLGKATAAFQAIKLAAGYFTAAAAATATATAATVAHTVAVQANTAAQVGNAAATEASVATTGRLAGAFATLKAFTLVGILTNVQEIGTALGQGAAKLMGYGKALEEAERAAKADEEATRANAAAKAALAQATSIAADKALGLNKEARELVAEFDDVKNKTNDATQAIDKLAKGLRLSDIQGIQAAGAALDALGQKGKASASLVQRALGEALKGADLGIFEVNARAAFDSSEQGARRLKAALDAIADESLRRAGTSAEELRTGFSRAAASASNDFDVLVRTLRSMGATADESGRVLATALDKSLTAANTERAVAAVLARMEELGKAGMLTGDLLTEGLEKARKKLDDLRPGVNSLAEAMRVFGLQTRDQAQQLADRMGQAYRQIAGSAQVSLADQIAAYAKWREAALSASGGVESQHLAEQRVILENRAAVAGLGDTYAQAMGKAGTAVDSTRGKVRALTEEVNAAGERLNQSAAGINGGGTQRNTGSLSTIKSDFDINQKSGTIGSTYTAPPDNSGDYEWVATREKPGGSWQLSAAGSARRDKQRENQNAAVREAYARAGLAAPGGAAGLPLLGLPRAVLDQLNTDPATGQYSLRDAAPATVATPSAAAPDVGTTSTQRYEVTIRTNSGSATVNVGSAAQAEGLASLLRALENDMARTA